MLVEWAQFLESGLPPASTEGEAAGVQNQASVTIGIFDGVHRGHQALIKRMISYNPNNIPVVITFRETDLSNDGKSAPIQTFQERIAMLESLGVKIIIVIDFTESFRRITGIEFLETLLKHGNIGFLAVGSNFRCGYKLDTDAAAIRDFFALRNIPVEIVPQVMEGSLPISSSRIRAAIAAGDYSQAEAMLGRN